jgi:hypothetical protein
VRPDSDAIVVDPASLADGIARYHPYVSICSVRSVNVETRVPSWVLLSPDGANAAVTSVVGKRQETDHLSFADLVAVVDRAAHMASQLSARCESDTVSLRDIGDVGVVP